MSSAVEAVLADLIARHNLRCIQIVASSYAEPCVSVFWDDPTAEHNCRLVNRSGPIAQSLPEAIAAANSARVSVPDVLTLVLEGNEVVA